MSSHRGSIGLVSHDGVFVLGSVSPANGVNMRDMSQQTRSQVLDYGQHYKIVRIGWSSQDHIHRELLD